MNKDKVDEFIVQWDASLGDHIHKLYAIRGSIEEGILQDFIIQICEVDGVEPAEILYTDRGESRVGITAQKSSYDQLREALRKVGFTPGGVIPNIYLTSQIWYPPARWAEQGIHLKLLHVMIRE